MSIQRKRQGNKVCSYPGCGAVLHRYNKVGLCRSDFMRSLHEDEAWEAKNRERASKRWKAMHADPVFAKKHSERISATMSKPEYHTPEIVKKRVEGFKRKMAEDADFAEAWRERSRQKMVKFNGRVRDLEEQLAHLKAKLGESAP